MPGPMAAPIHIAMWSGPRNVSTALLRSFGSRADTAVCDEPLYAHYLAVTGLPHPGAQQIIARHDADWRSVAGWLTGPVPDGRRVFYQKHMAHHLLPEIGREWLEGLSHAFLIRRPAAMLASLVQVIPSPRLVDTGLPQQVELFERLLERDGVPPPVIDSDDLLADPAGVLARLCERLGLPFAAEMLAWEPGPRPTDGCWAPHWYASVEASTGFHPYAPSRKHLPASLEPLAEACEELYERLAAHRLTA